MAGQEAWAGAGAWDTMGQGAGRPGRCVMGEKQQRRRVRERGSAPEDERRESRAHKESAQREHGASLHCTAAAGRG